MNYKWSLFFNMIVIIIISNHDPYLFSNCLQQSQQAGQNKRILPFTSIKMKDDQILFTLSTHRDKWHKLLSIDNVGTDAIVKFSKDHFGLNKCDYKIECFKYNLIVNFDYVFSLLENKKFPEHVGLEYEEDNKIQTGIDCESTYENFKINENNLADNFKQSHKESGSKNLLL